MTLTVQSEVRDVHGIDDDQKSVIKAFLQGAVYCWIKNRKGDPFAARDFVGGENRNWGGTPLQELYDKHRRSGKNADEARDAAGKDLGWLLKAVLDDDKHNFDTTADEFVKHYQLVQPASVP